MTYSEVIKSTNPADWYKYAGERMADADRNRAEAHRIEAAGEKAKASAYRHMANSQITQAAGARKRARELEAENCAGEGI